MDDMERSIGMRREMQDVLLPFNQTFRCLRALKVAAERDFAMMHWCFISVTAYRS
jgi:hypothetical protein